MNLKKLFHSYKDDNVAVPEFHSEEYDNLQDKTEEEENKERGEKEIFYDNVEVPEVHFHHKKKSK